MTTTMTPSPTAPAPASGIPGSGGPGGDPNALPVQPGVAPPIAPSVDEWMLQAAPTIREEPFIQEHRGKSLGEFIQNAYNAHQEVGRRIPAEKALVVPTDPAAPEWQGVLEKLRPESPEQYALEIPESLQWDDEATKGVRQFLWENGFSQPHAQSIVKYLEAGQAAEESQLQQDRALQKQQDDAALRKVFGAQYDTQMELATRMMKEQGLDEELKRLDLDTHPGLVQLLAKFGGVMQEGGLEPPGTPPSGGGSSVLAINQQLAQLRESPLYQQGDPVTIQEIERLTGLRIQAEQAAAKAPQY